MRTLRPLLAVGLVLLLAGVTLAQPKPQEAILGKWQTTEKVGDAEAKILLEFAKEGKLKVSFEINAGGMVTAQSEQGTYKWAGDDAIEVTTKEKTTKLKVKVSDKELMINDEKGKEMKFTRVK